MASVKNISSLIPGVPARVDIFTSTGGAVAVPAADGAAVGNGQVVYAHPGTSCTIHGDKEQLAAYVLNNAGAISVAVYPPAGITVSGYPRYYSGSYRYDLEISDPHPPFNIGIRG